MERTESHEYRFSILLVALLTLLLLFPFVETSGKGEVVFSFFFTAVLLAAILAVSGSRLGLLVGLGLGVPALGARWATEFSHMQFFYLEAICALGLLSFVSYLSLSHALKSERIDSQKIYAAVVVYLLIALIFSILFLLLHEAAPAAFRGLQPDVHSRSEMVYYSFVTLTTLGYGDITPVSPQARFLSAFEALLGQIYLAVLVARLVALHITHSEQG